MIRVPVLRTVLQVSRRAFGSAGVRLCEKKEGTTSAPSEDVKSDGTERLQMESKRSEEKDPSLEQRTEVRSEAVTQDTPLKPQAQTQPAAKAEENEKAGKKGLLELLGAMKVDVTSKRRLKVSKVQQSGQEAPSRSEQMASSASLFQQASRETPARESLSPELVAAASAAASTLPDASQAKSELLRQLRKHEAVSQDLRKGDARDIGNIIADMKVGKRQNGRPSAWPANQIRFDEDGRGYTHDRSITSELDGVRRRKSALLSKRLNIFPVDPTQEKDSDLAVGPTLWDADLASQISQALNLQPRNGFEEMIQWTKEGKMWSYPINNEAGMEEEASVPFHEHVFLERHLEDGFPQQGPIRHFMELVVTGLSKNHQLSVREKLEHIAWFREYFQEKQNILKEAESY